jgi:hypothetical protein
MDTHEQLLRAAKSGDLEGLASLLDAHPSLVDTRDHYGWTLLCHAALNGHTELLRRASMDEGGLADPVFRGRANAPALASTLHLTTSLITIRCGLGMLSSPNASLIGWSFLFPTQWPVKTPEDKPCSATCFDC